MTLLIILLFVFAWGLLISATLFLYRIARVLSEAGESVNYMYMQFHMFRYLHRFRTLPPEVQSRAGNAYRNFWWTSILGWLLGLFTIALLAYRLGTFQSLLG